MLIEPNHYKLRTVVLEDEPDNLAWLVDKLKRFNELDIVSSATTVDDAFRLIIRSRPDAAFIDIELIGGNAFALLERLRQHGIPIPLIVITTGFPDYIWTTFNDYRHVVVQYITKPFGENWEEKFRKAIDALFIAHAIISPPPAILPLANAISSDSDSDPNIFIKNRGNIIRLDPTKICYLESAGGGEIFIVNELETLQIDYTLNKFSNLLPRNKFLRISKCNVVNISRIVQINRHERTLELFINTQKSKQLGIGEVYYSDLLHIIQNTVF